MNVKNLTTIAIFAALTAVLSQIQLPLPFTPVPINLALFAVVLAGAVSGPRVGAAAMAVYMGLGALGVPVFAKLNGGLAALMGPTGGYIIGYVLCAALTGFLIENAGFSALLPRMAAMAAGILACYALGTAWFMISLQKGLLSALTLCVLPFLPGDMLKILVAAPVSLRIKQALHKSAAV